MRQEIVVKKGTKRQILSYFYRILAGISVVPSHKKFYQEASNEMDLGDDDAKAYQAKIQKIT